MGEFTIITAIKIKSYSYSPFVFTFDKCHLDSAKRLASWFLGLMIWYFCHYSFPNFIYLGSLVLICLLYFFSLRKQIFLTSCFLFLKTFCLPKVIACSCLHQCYVLHICYNSYSIIWSFDLFSDLMFFLVWFPSKLPSISFSLPFPHYVSFSKHNYLNGLAVWIPTVRDTCIFWCYLVLQRE